MLVDAGPEFRLQAIRAGIERLDALLLTHAHADHIHGLDDVRPLSRRAPLPVYGNESTLRELRERFAYVFGETQKGGGKPNLSLIDVAERGNGAERFSIGELAVTPIPAKHGRLDILGWRFEERGKAAVYLTDVSSIPHSSLPLLEKADVLFLGALRERAHETHFNFDQALEAIAEAAPARAYLTHLCHDRTHAEVQEYIREKEAREHAAFRTEPAWDGLTVTVK